MKKVTVIQNPESEIPAEIMAEAIVEIAEAVKRLRSSRLNDKAILILLSKSSNQPQHVVKSVLDAAESMAKTYLKGTK